MERSGQPRVTLEQWRSLVAVVDQGGYAQAARASHKSQSAISYSIRTLEERLGVSVFEIQGRSAVLTEPGRLLYNRARLLIGEAVEVEQLAQRLSTGWETQIRIAVEVIFPLPLAFDALAAFEQECATTHVELYESVLSGTHELITGGQVDMAITGLIPAGFIGRPLCGVEFLLVAHPDHPLHHTGRPLELRDLEGHRHLVARDSGSERRLDAGWTGSRKRWTVSTLHASIEAIVRGLGFAWLPRSHISKQLADGRLAPLPLESGATRELVLHLVIADPDGAGPGTRRLAELLLDRCQTSK